MKNYTRFIISIQMIFVVVALTAVFASAAPVAHWKFDDTVADASGNGYSGTLNGGAGYVTGKYGKALEFDGSNDYVSVAVADHFGSPTELTVMAWVKRADNDGNQVIASAQAYTSPFNLDMPSLGNPRAVIRTSGTALAQTTQQLRAGEWEHVAMTYTNGSLVLYIYGNEVARNDGVALASLGWDVGILNIGSYDNGTNPFEGLLDDVRVYTNALSRDDVRWAMFNDSQPVNTPPMVQPVDAEVNMNTANNVITLDAYDVDGDTLIYTYTQPVDGSVSGAGPDVLFTPNTDFIGTDGFEYYVNDGSATSTSTVSITVLDSEVNKVPAASPQSPWVDVNSQNNPLHLIAMDPNERNTLIYSYNQPAHGSVSGTAPDVTYTPSTDYAGSDSFDFIVEDDYGLTDTGTVSITVQNLPVEMTTWRAMPIRTEWEFTNSNFGGEGEQLFHGIARCEGNPDYVYLNEDVDAGWRSEDGGYTWNKTMDRGMKCSLGFSIEVDPINPLLVFSMTDGDNEYYEYEAEHRGLYRSENGGGDWERVFDIETNIEWAFHRGYRHCIDFDPSSVNGTNATTWYLAIQSGEYTKDHHAVTDEQLWTYGGIYQSIDSGKTWHLQGTTLQGYDRVSQLHVHPTNPNILYLATGEGILVSYDKGVTVQSLGDLPLCDHSDPMEVRSIAINPQNPSMIYVGLADTHYYVSDPEYTDGDDDGKKIYTEEYDPENGVWEQSLGKGIYKSTNGGTNFTRTGDATMTGMSVYINPGYPDYLHALAWGTSAGWTSKDGAATWSSFVLNADSYVAKHTDTGEEITRAFATDQSGLAPNPNDPNDIVGFGSGSILRSTDGGDSFGPSRTKFTGFASAFYSAAFMYDPFDPDWLGMSALDITMVTSDTAGAFFNHVNVKQIHQWHYEDTFTAPLSSTNATIASAKLIDWFGSVSGALQPLEGSDVIVAAVGKYFYNYLMRSDDRGATWTFYDETVFCDTIEDYKASTRLYNFIGFDTNATDTVYAGDKVSYDTGISWTRLPTPVGVTQPANPHSGTVTVAGLAYDAGGTWVYVVEATLGGIYRARTPIDQPEDWEEVIRFNDSSWQFHGIDRKPIVVINPGDPATIIVPGDDYANPGTASFGLGCQNDGRRDLVILRDGVPTYSGLIDQVRGSGLGTYMSAAIFDPSNSNIVYAAFSSQGIPTIFRSEDQGSTWINIDGNRPWGGECVLSVHPVTGELFVGSTFGTWILPPPYASDTPNYDRQFYPGLSFSDPNPATIPINLGGAGINEKSLELTWDKSTHSEGGVMYYGVFRNGTMIDKSYLDYFVDTGADLPNGLEEYTSYTYKLASVSRAGVTSAESTTLVLSTTYDYTPPVVLDVPPTTAATLVKVVFDELLQASSANDSANYAIDQGITVQSAELQPDGVTVILTTTSMSAHDYTLTISGVQDASSQNNVIITVAVPFNNWVSDYPTSEFSYWPLNGHVRDLHEVNDGAWSGVPTYGNGWIDQGIELNGAVAGSSVAIIDNPSLSGMSALTFSLWAKKDDAEVGGYVFEKPGTYRLSIDSGTVGYYVNLNGTNFSHFGTVTEVIEDTAWHHYALVVDGTNLALYIDGAMIETNEVGHLSTGVVTDSGSGTMYIGGNPSFGTFAGSIDEVKMFESALSNNEVMALALDQEQTFVPPVIIIPPVITEVPPTVSPTNLVVFFDKPMDAATANNAANYAIDQSVSVYGAMLNGDQYSVILSTSVMSARDYQLTVSGVRDATANNVRIVSTNVPFENFVADYPASHTSYWPFDGSPDDVTGSNDGEWVNGDPSYGEGRVDQGLALNGQTHSPRIQVPDSVSLDGMSQLSFSFWAKKTAVGGGGAIIEKASNYRIIINGGTVSYYLKRGGVITHFGPTVASSNDTEWHHYCLVYNGALLKLYVDGVEASSDVQTGTVDNEASDLFLGGSTYSTVESFAGDLDEVKMFSAALTPDQVMALSLEQQYEITPPVVINGSLLIIR